MFTVPGDPVAKGRARAFIRNGHVAHYTPSNTVAYENTVRTMARQAMAGRDPLAGPVALVVRAAMRIPGSWSRKRQQAAGLGTVVPTSRPDLDNLVKAIKDGCNGVVWRDDAQVIELLATKRYGHTPCVHVRIDVVADVDCGQPQMALEEAA